MFSFYNTDGSEWKEREKGRGRMQDSGSALVLMVLTSLGTVSTEPNRWLVGLG